MCTGALAMGAPQRRRAPRRRGRAKSDAERRALAKAVGRHASSVVPAPRSGYAVLSTDGGSRGNPGQAAIGYVLAAPDGTVLAEHSELIGIAGANVAEYRALLSGLAHASRIGLLHLEVRCDARLIVEQVTGHRAPANPRLRELCGATRAAAESIGTVIFTWVPSEGNSHAHGLVAKALRTQP